MRRLRNTAQNEGGTVRDDFLKYIFTWCRLLHDGGHLVAINKSRYYKREDGVALGTGAFVAALGRCQHHSAVNG